MTALVKLILFNFKSFSILLIFVFCLITFAQDNNQNPKLNSESKMAREQSLRILDEMQEKLNNYYYDPKFHGIDLKTRIENAKARVKTLQYNWQMYRVLVQVLMDLNDSHTRMLLPTQNNHFQYGFGLQMVGDDCFITSVSKNTDAQNQGLEVGDQIISLGKFKPNRRDLWKMLYVLYKLDPADTLDLKIKKIDGTEKALTIKAKTMTDKEFIAEQKARKEKNKDKEKDEPYKCKEISGELIACKLYSFVVEKGDVDKMMKEVSKYPKFILDLRGNGGGYVAIEQYLLSYFFDHEVKIADLVTREKTEVRVTKPLNGKLYKGEVTVLIDSNSASAAEMTSKVLQLEKRAKILGDISSGSVMTSVAVPFTSIISQIADSAVIKVGMSLTIADVIMSDGTRLENVGVVPDEVLQPTGEAFAKKTDPVLAYAAYKFGVNLTPEKAGEFYFVVEKPEDADDTDSDDNK